MTGIAVARSASCSGVKGLKGRACARGRVRALGWEERESGMIAPV